MLKDLNDTQKDAVLSLDQPTLILAGAGSGKTRVITYKIAYLISININPENILAITFTNKAANEMKERAEKLTLDAKKSIISTFHSLGVKILRKEIKNFLDYKNNFSIIDSRDSLNIIKECLKELNFDDKTLPIKILSNKISFSKNKLILPKDYILNFNNDFKSRRIANIYELYQKKLMISNLLDYDDLITLPIKIFLENKDVLDKYKDKFKFILIDEYQDTNSAQYELIKLLVGDNKNIFVVGDDDQGIYSWRGADINNILNFENDFKNSRTIKLEQNYRSTQIILNAANSLIKNNINRKEKKLWTKQKDGEKIVFCRTENHINEAKFICETIQKNKFKNIFDYEDCAILYRNNFQSRSIEDEFVKKNIAYKIIGATKFYERLEIKDLLAYLKLVNNIDDNISFLRVINTPRRGIGESTINKIKNISYKNNSSYFSSLDDQEFDNSKKIIDFKNMIKDFILYSEKKSVYNLAKKIILDINFDNYLKKQEDYDSRIENINELLAKINEFENLEENICLNDFLEHISLLSDLDNYNEKNNLVTLMTIHSSKGLEFPCVFLTGLDQELFPGYKINEELEEERRLFYVGITRAKKKIYITSSESRFRNGEFINSEISCFLNEISNNLIDELSWLSI
ncbi:MAG: UvrD-helicase domain-containing protein [Clostridiales bacterium]|jgi:DNA helicase-2/ATP-dependent DNA helicase PcrA|nr:UvrD-helicase domain-containing protein [Clostridiales bacterium]